MEYSVVDFIQLSLLKRSHDIASFHLADKLVLILSQAFWLAVAEQLVELLLAGIASTIHACCFAEPVNGCLDACGGCDLLNGITQAFGLPSTLRRCLCNRFGFVLLHFLGY